MIKMTHGDPPAVLARQFLQHAQQNHGINAPRHGGQNPLAPAEQSPGENRFFNLVEQIAHAPMLGPGGGDGNSTAQLNFPPRFSLPRSSAVSSAFGRLSRSR